MKRLALLAACGSAPTAPIHNEVGHPAPLGKLLAKQASHMAITGDDIYVIGPGPVYISHDRGATFAPWSEDAALCASMVLAAGRTAYALAARCSDTDVQTDPDRLYRSTDAGATWERLDQTSMILVGVDPRDPRIVYAEDACGGSAPCRSDDGGATWAAIPAPGRVMVADDSTLYASADRVFRSTDHGASWTAIAPTSGYDVEAREADGSLLALDVDHCGILRSTGGTFAPMPAPTTTSCEPGRSLSGHGRYACAVFADDMVVASADNGVSWHALSLPHAYFGHTVIWNGVAKTEPGTARFSCIAQPDRILIAALDGLYAERPPW